MAAPALNDKASNVESGCEFAGPTRHAEEGERDVPFAHAARKCCLTPVVQHSSQALAAEDGTELPSQVLTQRVFKFVHGG